VVNGNVSAPEIKAERFLSSMMSPFQTIWQKARLLAG